MSHLLAPTHTYADSIPLGRRITEIMTEKGPAYTIAAMAKRLEINRETLRLMLKGEREIYVFELEKIAQDLKVPVKRILQSDIAEDGKRVKEMLNKNVLAEQQQTLEIAQKNADLAIGLTERIVAKNDLAYAYYNMRQYHISHPMYTNTLRDAELFLEKYGEPEYFLWIVCNLVHSKTLLREYSGLPELVAKAEPYFDVNPRAAGLLCYAMARLKEECEGDYEGARRYYYQDLGYYLNLGKQLSIARGELTVGIFEYRQSNYGKALELLKNAWSTLRSEKDLLYRIISTRDYAKLLVRLNQPVEAERVLLELINEIETFDDFSDMEAEIYLILAITTDDPMYAKRIITNEIGMISIQKLAVKFLVHHYEKTGDLEQQHIYETIFKQLRGAPIDLLLRGTSGDPIHLLALHDFCHQQRWHIKS